MTKVSLLQIGDIHYPEWNGAPYESDDKDRQLNQRVKAGVSLSPTRLVLSRLEMLASSPQVEAIAFMGDFTSWGKSDGLRSAIMHMSWLCKADRRQTARPQLLMVPGNHDVSKEDAIKLGQFAKFDLITRYADEGLFHKPPVDQPHCVKIGTQSTGFVHVFMMNTSLGSWEKYLLPKEMQHYVDDDISSSIYSMADVTELAEPIAGVPTKIEAQGPPQLDTPYVSAKALSVLSDMISAIPKGDAVVVVGHHNILPQKQPRLSLYPEMINAGFFRRALLDLDRPILYLHGHTHLELIEEIRDPRRPRAKIIAVSAPKLEDGFNEVAFHFDGRRSALGVRILPWRVSADRDAFRAASDDQAASTLQNGTALEPSSEARVLHNALTAGARYNIFDVTEVVETRAINLAGRTVENLLLELFFWRWLEIDRSGSDSSEWIVFVPRSRGG